MYSAYRRGLEDDGFSLIELLTVVLILGILVSIALLSFNFTKDRSEASVCQANLRTIRGLVNQYLFDNGEGSLPDLQTLVPDYLQSENSLKCPVNRVDYVYDPVTNEVFCPNDGSGGTPDHSDH